ncbi:PAS domain S-box protein [Natrononativus amylolyticus]|uniref:PAS domain S-box protein n=1 Tax=Natrononativus amylolyticus TaxID=2963434 RepID=UPI0020CC2285|nr:PAS domain S-box protein [Natrononativus amylolyticus]
MKPAPTDSSPLRVLTAGSTWVHAATTGLEGEDVTVERRITTDTASLEGGSILERVERRNTIDCVLTDDLEAVSALSDRHLVIFAADRGEEHVLEEALERGAREVVTRADCERTRVLRNRLERAVRCFTARRETADRETWYRTLLEHSSTVIQVLDTHCRRTYVSPAVERIAGYEVSELIGQPATDVVHAEDRETFRSAFERVREAPETTESCVFRSRHADERWRIHEATFTNRLSDPTVDGIVVSIRDVTAYDRIERELNEAFERVTDAFIALDSDWRFSYVNERAAELLGYEESELLDREFFEVFPETTDTPFVEAATAAVERQEPRTIEDYYDQRDLWLEARIYPSASGLSVYFKDVSERVERTERLETLVGNVPTILFSLDSDGQFVLSEGRGLEQLDLETGEVVGESIFDVFGDNPNVVDDARRALAGQAVHSTRRVGTREFETWYRPITRDGDVDRVIGVSVDVTDRVQYEQTLNALHEATRHLLTVDSKQTACEYIVDVSAEVLDLTGVVVYRFNDRENELLPAAYSADVPDRIGMPPRFRPNESIAWNAFVEETPALFDDVRESEHVYNPDTRIRSGLYVPLGEHGVLVAVSERPDLYDERMFELAQLFGATAETALDRIGRSQRLHERERELKQQNDRLERVHRADRLRQEIEALLLQADSRSEIERGVCERLCDLEACAFVWIGEPDPGGNQVLPRASAGAGGDYLDAVSVTIVDDAAAEPAGRTARTSQPTGEPNIASSIREGQWRGDALSRDLQSTYAVPLAHDGFLYGVLAVYANRRHGFDGEFQSTLTELGETIAYTIQAVQRKNTLLGDDLTEIELQVDDDSALSALATHLETAITLEGIIPRGDDAAVVFASVDDSLEESDLAAFDAAETIIISAGEGRTVVQLSLSRPFLGSIVDSHGGALREFVVDPSGARAVIDVPRVVEIRELLAAITRRGLSVSLLAKRDRSRSTVSVGETALGRQTALLDDLTDRQREVVQTAYHGGFFEWPRLTTGEELASSLGISPPAFHNHIRAVERKLFDSLFDRDQG